MTDENVAASLSLGIPLYIHSDGSQYMHHPAAFYNGATHALVVYTVITESIMLVEVLERLLLGIRIKRTTTMIRLNFLGESELSSEE